MKKQLLFFFINMIALNTSDCISTEKKQENHKEINRNKSNTSQSHIINNRGDILEGLIVETEYSLDLKHYKIGLKYYKAIIDYMSNAPLSDFYFHAE